ncbi:hypothetical protein ABBQ32_008269 [Trebouxia sp. C0010 RCD-2024]
MLGIRGSPGLICLPRVTRHVARLSTMTSRASAATLETATKQNVGAAASKSQTHVGLNSGHHMPLVGWGTSQATGDDCIKATKAAITAGFRHIDTAEQYKNETEIGKGLQELFKSGAIKREDLFVTSKLWTEHHPGDQVRPGLKDTLSRLQLEYLDLYLIHWPTSVKPGPKVTPPFSETWEALERCVEEGLIRSIGVSNFSPEKIEKFILPDAKIRPAVNQVEMHAHWRNDRLLKWCDQQGIHVSAYAPLSSPVTMASMEKDVPNLMEDETVNEIAKKLGRTAPQVLLRWGLQHGSSVLPKSANPDHLKENIEAIGWELSDEDFSTLSNLPQHRYFTGSLAMHEDGPWRNYEELWDEKDVSEPL